MAFWRLPAKTLYVLPSLAFLASLLMMLTSAGPAPAQSLNDSTAIVSSTSTSVSYNSSTDSSSLFGLALPGSGIDSPLSSANRDLLLPEAPAPAALGSSSEHYNVSPAAQRHQPPFSRIGIGADVSPLGIGLKSAIVLDEFFDARLMGNLFVYNSGRFEIEGFNVNANLHLASAAASLDWYPFNSVWRLSPGLMFFNANQLSISTNIVPGTSFTLSGQTFYAASANPATGATPLAGSGVLGLHTNRPAVTLVGGFGKFIPRSNRHWSFPSEFGVAFTGAPSANVNASGWVCLDAQQTRCSNVGDAANPVTVEFNNALQSSLTQWRKDLGKVQVYPLFSYSVVYSFNIR
jgi:hypothetical protein